MVRFNTMIILSLFPMGGYCGVIKVAEAVVDSWLEEQTGDLVHCPAQKQARFHPYTRACCRRMDFMSVGCHQDVRTSSGNFAIPAIPFPRGELLV